MVCKKRLIDNFFVLKGCKLINIFYVIDKKWLCFNFYVRVVNILKNHCHPIFIHLAGRMMKSNKNFLQRITVFSITPLLKKICFIHSNKVKLMAAAKK